MLIFFLWLLKIYSSWKGRSNSSNPRPTFEVPYLCVQPNSYREGNPRPISPNAIQRKITDNRRQGEQCFIEGIAPIPPPRHFLMMLRGSSKTFPRSGKTELLCSP
ncbi:hypothetical protein AVEN_139050-1 [Araneus ventricosus]|uniref:Uncharacterized protein n=1 Tax=Araneus ventricosus TaxID=182803 RepID=A0A4Y2N0X4_ARAVE|nr:hypothetical protein AVEN_139050-1 [Araneus ventricosus]